MKHIAQDKRMSCWYASAQMLVQWKRGQQRMTTSNLKDPAELASTQKMYEANNGIVNPQVVVLAKSLGLLEVPPSSPSENGLATWLRQYGPLWVNGRSHIVVLAGIRNEGTGNAEVLVYDPGVPSSNGGAMSWKALNTWFVGSDASSRDTGADVQAVFLYCPR